MVFIKKKENEKEIEFTQHISYISSRQAYTL